MNDAIPAIVACPSCGQQMRAPTTLGALKLTCPKCRHSWDWTPPRPTQEITSPPVSLSGGSKVLTWLHSVLARKPDVRSEIVLGIVFAPASVALFAGFVYPLCWLYLAVPLAIGLFAHLISAYQKKQDQQKVQEHEVWLRSPQGIAWQEEQREQLRKQREEEDRRRKEAEEQAARAKWNLYHESKTMDEVSRMTGRDFEEFLARLFARMGYTAITLTATNDQGGDILCLSPSGVPVVIQAKRWSSTVGNGAVQELLGAMTYYGCTEGMVVTNSSFTDAARELARRAPRVTLRDGRWLAEQIKKFLPSEIPEFNWDEYNRVVKDWLPSRVRGTRKGRFSRYRRRRW